MVKQYTENQYDDDLTLGNDEHDESYYTDADDLFEFSTDDESPISRLKSLVLSIDWEITDEVLLQFNEELLDLKGIWAGETINLVYVQALEKISKYIYQNKADSHPNAIKLLLTFYYNLEKIVSSQDLSEEQKKEILLEDVKKFENLKRQIKQKPSSVPHREPVRPQSQKIIKEVSSEGQLLNLKAIVLGIDWEITDQDLNDLRREVFRLEEKFSESRPKLILLQGIGTLATYIKVKKSNAHPDAFKVMQLFFEGLEKIVQKPMSLEAEKNILFPAVEKFNSFKALLGPTISPDAIIKKDDEAIEDYGSKNKVNEISPALADVSEEEVGFQADKEAVALGLKDSGGVASHIDNFFGENAVNQFFAEEVVEQDEKIEESPDIIGFQGDEIVVSVERDLALQGVDVEGDDEEQPESEDTVTGEDIFAPLDSEEPVTVEEEEAAFVIEPVVTDKVAQQEEEQEKSILTEEAIVVAAETIFPVDAQEFPEFEQEIVALDREKALQGVNVETDADDDTDELSLPMEGEELAPALAAMDEESLFSATTLDRAPISSSVSEEIVGTIDGLFLDHDGISAIPPSGSLPKEDQGIDANTTEVQEEELIGFEDWLKEDGKEEDLLSAAVAAEGVLEADQEAFVNGAEEPLPVEDEAENELATMDFVEDQEDDLSSFFTDNELEQSTKDGSAIDALFDSLETDLVEEEIAPPAIIDNVDTFFSSAEDREEPDEVVRPRVSPEKREEDVVEKPMSDLFAETDSVEEEVVFELFKEEIEPDVVVGQESGEERELPALATVLASDAILEIDLVGAPGDEIVEELAADGIAAAAERRKLEPLGALQVCIDSLKLELSDTIIAGLFQEINTLRQKWVEKPLEKTFLQLLSTITQHIDSYRYESSAEAYGLLVSICQTMSNLQADDPRGNQENLLGATLNVLEWQQGMLSRQAVKKGDQLIFADPLRTEKEDNYRSDAQKDFDNILHHYGDSATQDVHDAYDFPGEIAAEADDGLSFADEITEGKVMLEAENVEGIGEAFADDLKKEIAALRQTLQMEIAELRRELKKD